MRLLIATMIFLGSALMVYNILRYAAFVRSSRQMERNTQRIGVLIIPLLLLIFFLVGYIGVGLSGIANLLIAGILFGGSVFVFLLLAVMFSIINHMRSADQVLSVRYEEMRSELNALTKDSMAVFLVNLTKDHVEERAGDFLYESDYLADSYTELLKAREPHLFDRRDAEDETNALSRDALLRAYREGHTNVSEVLLVRRKDGVVSYVKFEATLSLMPVSNDVIAFITERPCNEEVIEKTLMENVLMDQYDRIAYLIDGAYHVVTSNVGKKEGMLFPDDEGDTYEELYLNHILPAQPKDKRRGEPNPLRLSEIDKALAKDRVYVVDAPFIRDGKERYKRISFYCIEPRAKFYLMLVSDSTALQEEQLAQNKRLQELLDDATRANQARTVFFSRMSHDLRTPMNGFLGFTNLARTEQDPQKAKAYMEKAETSGRQLLAMIEDLFDMSMIDNGTLQLDESPTDLRELGEKLLARVSAVHTDKNIRFQLDTDGLRDPVVLCDEPRLERALSRLLENSCAYVPEGESVTMHFRQSGSEAPQRGSYELSICNRGVEIPADVLDHLFEPRGWESSELQGKLPGVGLGMNVAKGFIDRMGGTISVSNGEAGETEFAIRISLPIVSEVKPEPPAPARDAKQMHVLLVEDNDINREIAELMLTAEGWTVEQAENGAEALEKVASSEPGHFDVVLMDVQMPVMNGHEATARIRRLPDPALASVPIIACTANVFEEDANEALAAGMDGYVTKPIDPDAIRKVVAKVLAEREERK